MKKVTLINNRVIPFTVLGNRDIKIERRNFFYKINGTGVDGTRVNTFLFYRQGRSQVRIENLEGKALENRKGI